MPKFKVLTTQEAITYGFGPDMGAEAYVELDGAYEPVGYVIGVYRNQEITIQVKDKLGLEIDEQLGVPANRLLGINPDDYEKGTHF